MTRRETKIFALASGMENHTLSDPTSLESSQKKKKKTKTVSHVVVELVVELTEKPSNAAH